MRNYKGEGFKKRQYEMIVKALAEANKIDQMEGPHDTWELILTVLSDMFEKDNPRFDKDKFYNTFYNLAKLTPEEEEYTTR
jgi:hypothetical protein